jgi:hypothetical protein
VVVDTGLAAVTVLLSLPTARSTFDVVLALAASAALIPRRVRPLVSGLLVAAAGLTAVFSAAVPADVAVPVLVTGYSLAAYGPRWSGSPPRSCPWWARGSWC